YFDVIDLGSDDLAEVVHPLVGAAFSLEQTVQHLALVTLARLSRHRDLEDARTRNARIFPSESHTNYSGDSSGFCRRPIVQTLGNPRRCRVDLLAKSLTQHLYDEFDADIGAADVLTLLDGFVGVVLLASANGDGRINTVSVGGFLLILILRDDRGDYRSAKETFPVCADL
ncbi:hypothetical protein PENTCL1PPCAC_18983, partial [Pristionchus entomophagus]